MRYAFYTIISCIQARTLMNPMFIVYIVIQLTFKKIKHSETICRSKLNKNLLLRCLLLWLILHYTRITHHRTHTFKYASFLCACFCCFFALYKWRNGVLIRLLYPCNKTYSNALHAYIHAYKKGNKKYKHSHRALVTKTATI